MDSQTPGVLPGSEHHEGDDQAHQDVCHGQGDDEPVESLLSQLLGLQDDCYQTGVCQEDEKGCAEFENVVRRGNYPPDVQVVTFGYFIL